MRYSCAYSLWAAFALAAVSSAAEASSCTITSVECSASLSVISATNIGSGSQGTVTLKEIGADEVEVEVSLASGVKLINSSNGNSHTPFAFNLSSSLTGVQVAIEASKSNGSPATFFVLSGSQPATPYGTFSNGIGYNGRNGGGHGNTGPLFFTVTDTNGINLTDFVSNGSGYLFAADLLGTGGSTGSVAAGPLSCVLNCGTSVLTHL